MEIQLLQNVFIFKGGDIINRQEVYDSLKPCIDNQASIIRMFNVVPELSIDIYVNNNPRILDLEYRELSDYMPTVPGRRNVKIYNSGTNTLLLEIQDFEIPAGQIITYAFYGSPSNLKLIQIVDDVNERLSRDRTKIRFYNLDSNNITLGTNPVIGTPSRALTSGQGSEYFEVNPGTYNLQVSSSNQRPKTISLNLNPGRLYTTYIFGSVNPDSPNYSKLNISQIILVVDGNTLFHKCI